MGRQKIVAAIVVFAAIAAAIAVIFMNNPEGSEWVSGGFGFASSTEEASAHAPLGGYDAPELGHSILSTFIAGVIGIAGVFIVVFLIGRIIHTQMRLRRRGAR